MENTIAICTRKNVMSILITGAAGKLGRLDVWTFSELASILSELTGQPVTPLKDSIRSLIET